MWMMCIWNTHVLVVLKLTPPPDPFARIRVHLSVQCRCLGTASPALTLTMLNAVAALRKAFQLADTNYNANYDSGCQTAFVFLTDGEQTEVYQYFLPLLKPCWLFCCCMVMANKDSGAPVKSIGEE